MNLLVQYVKDPQIYYDRVASIDLNLSNKKKGADLRYMEVVHRGDFTWVKS